MVNPVYLVDLPMLRRPVTFFTPEANTVQADLDSIYVTFDPSAQGVTGMLEAAINTGTGWAILQDMELKHLKNWRVQNEQRIETSFAPLRKKRLSELVSMLAGALENCEWSGINDKRG